jgi:hypothetical protein
MVLLTVFKSAPRDSCLEKTMGTTSNFQRQRRFFQVKTTSDNAKAIHDNMEITNDIR